MKGFFAAALLAGLCCAATAEAATVTGVYYGQILHSSNPAFPYFSPGDTYRIKFSYDLSVPNDADPSFCCGLYLNAISGRIAFSNGRKIVFSEGIIFVGNDEPNGDFDFLNFGAVGAMTSNFPTGLYTLDGFSVSLVDFTRNVFSSDQLPTSYLPVALFGGAGRFYIGFSGPGAPSTGAGLYGTLSSTPTPIPAALPLFAAALAGLGIVGWRRRNLTLTTNCRASRNTTRPLS